MFFNNHGNKTNDLLPDSCSFMNVFYFLLYFPERGGEKERGRGDNAADDESPSGLHPFWLSAYSGPEPGPGI